MQSVLEKTNIFKGLVKIDSDSDQLKMVRVNQNHFETLFLASPNPIIVFNDSGILDCNPAAVKILGAKDRLELMSHHPAEFSPELQPDGSSSKKQSLEMDRMARVHGKRTFEWTHQKLDGTQFPVEVTLVPITWQGIGAIMVLWVDLTEKKKRDQQMVQNSKLIILGEMSASIAHEINNPLAVISGSLSLLQRMRDDPDKFLRQVEIIEKSVGRISKIVNGLKKFSRSGGRTVLTEFSLRKIVNESIGLIESQAKVRNVKVTTAMGLGDEFNVLCNELEIEQVLVNLLNNAIDAIEGLSEKWVRIELGRQGTEVILQVTDSGSGIPAGVRGHLFDPFFTTKPIGKGTGLGLSITKGILDEHRATIRVVEDLPNTCFEIRFPELKSP